MRNIAMVPGLLSLLLTGVLFYVVYHKPQPLPVIVSGSGGTQATDSKFRMAYFNLDTLESRYTYFKDVLDQVKGKENEMNAELSGMEKNYQKKITEWQKKASTMSQAESEQAQQEYAQMQQNYQVRKQTLQESLLKHNEDLKADIRKLKTISRNIIRSRNTII
jgi:outer membrane protein